MLLCKMPLEIVLQLNAHHAPVLAEKVQVVAVSDDRPLVELSTNFHIDIMRGWPVGRGRGRDIGERGRCTVGSLSKVR